jgi:hypothetical protein
VSEADAAWEFPCAGAIEGEPPEKAIGRAMGAELHGDIEIEAAWPVMEVEAVTLRPFVCRWIGEEPADAGAAFHWAAAHELDECPLPAAHRMLAQLVHDHLITAEEEAQRQQKLDALRIRQVVRARQAAMKAGTYFLVAAAACAVMAVDLIWRAARRYSLEHSVARPALYLLVAAVLAALTPQLWRRAMSLRREARERSLPEPTIPPDFSGLSDGSHVVRNLERMR